MKGYCSSYVFFPDKIISFHMKLYTVMYFVYFVHVLLKVIFFRYYNHQKFDSYYC